MEEMYRGRWMRQIFLVLVYNLSDSVQGMLT